MRNVLNHHIDDESLKEYFYRGKDDNNKAVLDTIAGGSYGECPYARKSDIGRNTFAVQSTHNPATDEIREEMAQMGTELGLVLKYVTRGEENINAVNYLAKPPPPNDDCYYAEDTYVVNEQIRGFRPSTQAQIRIIGAKVKGTKVGTMVTTNVRVIMSKMETTTATTTLTGVTMQIETTGMCPMSLLKIVKLLLGLVDIVWRELRICCIK